MTTTSPTTRASPALARAPARTELARSSSTAIRLIRSAAVAVTSAAFITAVLALAWYLYFLATGIIAPGVSAGGVALAGLNAEEAARSIDQHFNQEYRLLAIDTSEPARFWSVSPADVGLTVDGAATAEAALQVGRGSDPLTGLSLLLQSLQAGWQVTPVVRFDAEIGRAGLERWAASVDVPPVEGTLSLTGGQVAQSPGRAGKSLDVEATVSLLAADPTAVMLTYQFIPLVMVPVAPAIEDVSTAAGRIQAILDSAPSLAAYDPVTGERFAWSPGREAIEGWIRLEREERAYTVDVDPAQVRAYVEGLNATLGTERTLDLDQATGAILGEIGGQGAQTVIIHYLPTTRVVGPADTWISIGAQVGMPYWVVEEANPQIAGRGFRSGEIITIPPRDALLPLPIVVDKRIVISISEQRLYTYEDGQLLSEHVISTGIARSPTLPGIFQVQSHIENAYASNWDLWMPHFLGIYEAVPGFWNGIHGLPLLSNGVRLWANVLGRPASFGCIILTLDEAEWLYGWADDGVVVEIRR
jgi:lipoprotein-anchoring transpeptidase ErfK/SrfK